jgi:hypothetical protein
MKHLNFFKWAFKVEDFISAFVVWGKGRRDSKRDRLRFLLVFRRDGCLLITFQPYPITHTFQQKDVCIRVLDIT